MPRRVIGYDGFVDFFAYQQRARQKQQQGTVELYFGEGFTPEEEEESKDMQKTFEDIAAMGYEHIHTLIVEPSDPGRKPYTIHVDDAYRS